MHDVHGARYSVKPRVDGVYTVGQVRQVGCDLTDHGSQVFSFPRRDIVDADDGVLRTLDRTAAREVRQVGERVLQLRWRCCLSQGDSAPSTHRRHTGRTRTFHGQIGVPEHGGLLQRGARIRRH